MTRATAPASLLAPARGLRAQAALRSAKIGGQRRRRCRPASSTRTRTTRSRARSPPGGTAGRSRSGSAPTSSLRRLRGGALCSSPAAARGAVDLKRVDVRDYPTVRARRRHLEALREAARACARTACRHGPPGRQPRQDPERRPRHRPVAVDGRAVASPTPSPPPAPSSRRKNQEDRIAVVGFGSTAVDLTGFSSASIDADTALRSLAVDSKEGTALYDAVRLSAQALRTEPADARVIIVLTDGRDASSTASLSRAVAAARAARATVYPIGIESDQFSPAPLRQLAQRDRRLVPQRRHERASSARCTRRSRASSASPGASST